MQSLSSERAALGQLGLASCWRTQDRRTSVTGDGGLGMGKNGGDVQASRALDIHEKGSWRLDQGLQLMLLSFGSWVGVQQILN